VTDHAEGRKFDGIEIGTVFDNADPLMLGRVRVKIPGIADSPATGWAMLLGGGGKKNRGTFAPPDIGADVGVFLHRGNPDAPYYIGGHYGTTEGGRETPGPVGGYRGANDPADTIEAKDAPKVKAWEGDRYVVVCDERPGKERFFVRDKLTDDEVFLDGVKGGINIEGVNINIKATGTLNLDGAAVNICLRPVRRNGKAIT
jgi:uncharacterized protein involved in type VI secretion and phage assembly